jgi:multidrug efflux pump subunit AcrA (membrane-fusion protein)
VQPLLGVLLAAVCVLSCSWYVRAVTSAERAVLTGSVTSPGVLDLNFPQAGTVAAVLVRVGQPVRKNQLLAAEAAPGAVRIEAADAAAVRADHAQLDAQTAAAAIAAARAQLARDQAKLTADQVAIAQSRIVAPAAGVITAVDGQPGQVAAPAGVRDFVSEASAVSAPPLFSLLPESPQVSTKNGVTGSATLPMIELRTSRSWEVLMLVPAGAAGSVWPGQPVRVSVPAAGLADIAGSVAQVLATPVSTADGQMYEAIVTVAGSRAGPPLDGMTANITLSHPAAS